VEMFSWILGFGVCIRTYLAYYQGLFVRELAASFSWICGRFPNLEEDFLELEASLKGLFVRELAASFERSFSK